MPTLIALGYQDETTAAAAGEEVPRLSAQLGVPPDAVAALARCSGSPCSGPVRSVNSSHPAHRPLFVMVDRARPDLVLDAVERYGGRRVQATLTSDGSRP